MEPAARVRSISRTLVALLVARLAFPLLAIVVSRVVGAVAGGLETMQLTSRVLDGVEALLAFLTFIFFLVWLARVYRAIAARGGKTSMGAGLAIGGWFIPIANFLLPWLGLRSAWRGARPDSSAIVGAWWITYLLATSTSIAKTVLTADGYINPEFVSLYMPLHWLDLALGLANTGLWLAIVSRITGALSGPTPAPASGAAPSLAT